MGNHRGISNYFGLIAMTLTGILLIVAFHQASSQILFRPQFDFPPDISDMPSQLFGGRLYIRHSIICFPMNNTEAPSVPTKINSTNGVEDSDNQNKDILSNCYQQTSLRFAPRFKDDDKIQKPENMDDISRDNQRPAVTNTETLTDSRIIFVPSSSSFTWIHISIITIVIALCIAILVATYMMNRKIQQIDATRKARAELARMFSSRRLTANNNYTTAP